MRRTRRRRRGAASSSSSTSSSSASASSAASSSSSSSQRTPTQSRTRGRTRGSRGGTRGRRRRGRGRGRGEGANARNTTPSGRRKRLTERRFDRHRVANPFARKKRTKTSFATSYDSGDIPCRISHGGGMTRIQLRWDQDLENIPFNPYLLNFAEGLRETEHPYVVLSTIGFRELLSTEDAQDKALPLLPQIVRFVRMALMQNASFTNGLDAVESLVRCVGLDLVPHLNALLIQISKKAFNKKLSGRITEVLQTIEECAGEDATPVIKAKVPTYCSVFM